MLKAIAVLVLSASPALAATPMAYLYVIGNASGGTQIEGYSASRSGILTTIKGSPFAVGVKGGNNASIVDTGSFRFAPPDTR
jgi:hypothetical protein